jgi:hypothetical protein
MRNGRVARRIPLEIIFSPSRMKVEDERQLFRKACWKLKKRFHTFYTFYLLAVYSTPTTPTNKTKG